MKRSPAPLLLGALALACHAWPYAETGGGYIEQGGTYGEVRAGVVLTPKPEEANAPRPQPNNDEAAEIWDARAQGQPGPEGLVQSEPPEQSSVPGTVCDPCSELARKIDLLIAALAPAATTTRRAAPAGGAAPAEAPVEAVRLEERVAAIEAMLAVLISQADAEIAEKAIDAAHEEDGESKFTIEQYRDVRKELEATSWEVIGRGAVVLLILLTAYAVYRIVTHYYGKKK